MKKFIKVIIFVIFFASILIISELIYTINNRPRIVGFYYLWKAQIYADKNINQSLQYFFTGSNKFSKYNSKSNNPYPLDYAMKHIDIPINPDLENELKEYVKNPKLFKWYEEEFYDYPRILYDLSLIAYHHNNTELFTTLLKEATITDPGMSYWPVELANYYYSVGQVDLAFEILDNCKSIPGPAIHCFEVETAFKTNNESFDVGFLQNATDKIYNPNQIDLNSLPSKNWFFR